MEQRPTAAFVLSLLAGLWMLGTGGMMYGMGRGMMMSGSGPGFLDETSGVWGYCLANGVMRGIGPGLWFPWFGPLAGIVVLVGAISLYTRPEQSRTWGLVVIIAAAINMFVGMGGLLAAALGIVGGVLALSWKAPQGSSGK